MIKFNIRNWKHSTISFGTLAVIIAFMWNAVPSVAGKVDNYHVTKVETVMAEEVQQIAELKQWAARTDVEVALQNIRADLRALRSELYTLEDAVRHGDNARHVLDRIADIEAEIGKLEKRRNCLMNGSC